MSGDSLSKIPYWDGKAGKFRLDISKIEACAEFVGVVDALDPALMESYPTQWEYAAFDIVKPQDQSLIELYKANKKLGMVKPRAIGWPFGQDQKWRLSQWIRMWVCE